MKDAVTAICVTVLILGGNFFIQKSVDAGHSWWVFVIEGLLLLIGLALVSGRQVVSFEASKKEGS